jgi:pimeloyl-ACP methyl ester carboxylesterase
MTSPMRQNVRFPSGDTTCAAWHYPGDNGACLVMAGGLGVTKEPATDRLAPRFQAAGFSVLAIDFRGFGESGGTPRQVARAGDQRADLRAAIAFARTFAEVDPDRVALWGFSSSGGHVFPVAAGDPSLAAAIARVPLADGPAALPNGLRSMTPLAALRLNARAGLDLVRRGLGGGPVLIPLAGPRGAVAALTTPDGAKGPQALDPEGVYGDWRQEVAAGSALAMTLHRPGRAAPRVSCPLLVLAYDQDRSVLAAPAARAARRAPRGELVQLPGDHYTSMTDGLDQAVELELDFLRRHVVRTGRPTAVAA